MTQPSPGSEPDTTGNPYTHADDEPEQRPVDTIQTNGEYL